jgi:hypothetical protein
MVAYSRNRVFTEWPAKVQILIGALGIFLLSVYLSLKNVGTGDGFSYKKFSATWKWLIQSNHVYCLSIGDDWKANSSFKCVVVS